MREKLNEDPKIQLAIFGIAALILIVFVLKPFGGGDEAAPTADGTVPVSTEGVEVADGTASPGGEAPAPAPVSPSPSAPTSAAPDVPTPTPAVSNPTDKSGDLKATDGFPKNVVETLNDGRLAVIFFYDPNAFSDRKVRGYTERLRGDRRLDLYTVPEDEIADYARITGSAGLAVDRTPALVTVAPPEASGSEPIATVTYQFRRPKSVRQAVVDSLYDGRLVTSFPRREKPLK